MVFGPFCCEIHVGYSGEYSFACEAAFCAAYSNLVGRLRNDGTRARPLQYVRHRRASEASGEGGKLDLSGYCIAKTREYALMDASWFWFGVSQTVPYIFRYDIVIVIVIVGQSSDHNDDDTNRGCHLHSLHGRYSITHVDERVGLFSIFF